MNRRRAQLDRWTAWSPALLLAALAALTFWLDAQVQAPEPPGNVQMRHDPDLFITRFRAVSFDRTGRVKQSLTAERAEHHPDDESVDFTAPSLVITDPGRPTLSVKAQSGTLSGDRETVVFRGDVEAVRESAAATAGATGGSGPVKLTTDFLRVYPDKGIAETDRPVTIEESRGIIHGVGMTLDNQQRSLKLKSGVRGTMQPESSK